MFGGFDRKTTVVDNTAIHFRIGGSGPPLLLLHGHPQTHAIWHVVAPILAKDFTVIAADLRGYGDSDKPPASPDHRNYRKSVMAADQVGLMKQLGFERFSLLAHDRGARVGYRLALDSPERLDRMVLLDILPTLSMYEQTHEAFARAYWHWFFLIRPAPMPERIIEQDPRAFLEATIGARSDGLNSFHPSAVSEYERCLSLPGAATGICEDYRASAGPDLQQEKADRMANRKITVPTMVLWGEDGTIGQCFDVMKEWRKWATSIQGHALPCGHYIPEEQPDMLIDKAMGFFSLSQ